MKILTPLLAAVLLPAAACAHVTIDPPEAEAGSTVKAAFRVGHGCSGRATHALVVRLPEGLGSAKPVPKAGWTLALAREGDRLAEIRWQAAGREAWLEDAYYDEFVIRVQLPATPGPLWFRVGQVCDGQRMDWAEVPASGDATTGLAAPAARLLVRPAAAATGHAHH